MSRNNMARNNTSDESVSRFGFQDCIAISTDEWNASRRNLLCPRCGLQCYRRGLFEKIPLTIPGKIFEGRCLRCYPIDPKKLIQKSKINKDVLLN